MWDKRYSAEEFVYGTEPNDFLKEQYTAIPKGGKVLCLAEGEGRNAVFLAKQGYIVTAVDQSIVGLEKAQKLAESQGVSINTIAADLADFDFTRCDWDGMVSIFAHLPPALRRHVHKQVVGSLSSGGVFILEAYTAHHTELEGVGGPPASKKELFMSLTGLKQELSGLTFKVGAECERHISEGTLHTGQSAVVQVVAKKQ